MTLHATNDSPRIKQLDDRTIGFIAAGEVVERPAQVVKELLENSIDAGSKSITVELLRGGFDLISVIDDGNGIIKEDLPLALVRHATSKLQNEADLEAINTLGFRGEALASIGMVSELIVASKARKSGEDNGWTISMKDGEISGISKCGMPEGCKIEVKSIFKSQPARLSFQRRPSTESVKILEVVVKQALANSEVRIRLISDGKILLEAPQAEDPLDRLYDLLGAQTSRLLELRSPPSDIEAPGEENWSGWISPPDISRSKGDEVHLLINGRPVGAQPFQAAIRRGYHTRLMVGRHPVCVISLEIPHDEVDVNVHPTKREVRLKNSWRVLERLERAIMHTLSTTPTDTEVDDASPLSGLPRITSKPQVSDIEKKDAPSWVQSASTPELVQVDLEGSKLEEQSKPKPKARPISESPVKQGTLTGMDETPIAPALSSQERALHRYSAVGESESPLDETELDSGFSEQIPELVPLSQFADSYILAQGEDSLYIIDQHALHERIRYERLRHGLVSWNPQPLIETINIDLSVVESAAASQFSERLNEIGITFQQNEGEWSLSCVPMILAGDKKLTSFVHDLLCELAEAGSEGRLDAVENLQNHIAFMKSCRGAVKANQRLNIAEMRRLLDDMRRISNPWACVHGRPTVLKLEADALDHHFGRHG